MVDLIRSGAVYTGEISSNSFGAVGAPPVPASAVFAFVVAAATAKLFASWATGFMGDESYTIVISRALALSYYDHPPLHQWIVHWFSALFGEGWWLKLPFVLMIAGMNGPLYGLTRLLFGKNAAVWALFGFNATAYFVVWPDGYIMPDAPLFLFLTVAIWAVAEILFGPPRSASAYTLLWLVAGTAFGLAGLSKYSALFAAASLFGFVAFSPRHRHWLWRLQTYLGALLALAIFLPALVWNYLNGWHSFAFQLGRAGKGVSFGADALNHTAQALSRRSRLSRLGWAFRSRLHC
jgi:4-amino-4-deoxy-L-arabinose transferase-like glycosyltransferase